MDSWEGQVHLHCWLFPYSVPWINSACCWACSCNQQGNNKIFKDHMVYKLPLVTFATNQDLVSDFLKTCRFSQWSLPHSSVNSLRMLKRKLYRKFNYDICPIKLLFTLGKFLILMYSTMQVCRLCFWKWNRSKNIL